MSENVVQNYKIKKAIVLGLPYQNTMSLIVLNYFCFEITLLVV